MVDDLGADARDQHQIVGVDLERAIAALDNGDAEEREAIVWESGLAETST